MHNVCNSAKIRNFPYGGVNFKGIITYINFARPNYTTETKQTEKQPDMHL